MAKKIIDLTTDAADEFLKLFGSDNVSTAQMSEIHMIIGRLVNGVQDITESKSLKQILRSVLND